MEFDVFFSISQTPVAGHMPDEAAMFQNWMEQVEAADRLGFGVAWLAESHLSSEVQKRNRHPVIPHWQGEVGLNCDMLQSAHAVFARTGAGRRDGASTSHGGRGIEVGSAVMNILQGGGPIAHAERIAFFASLEGLKEAPRRIHVGFSAGRFDYMNRAHGYVQRDELERAVPYPFLKGKWFHEATEVFCRLLSGQTLSSDDVPERSITQDECRTQEDWLRIREAGKRAGRIEMRPPPAALGETAAGGAGASMIPARGAPRRSSNGAEGVAGHREQDASDEQGAGDEQGAATRQDAGTPEEASIGKPHKAGGRQHGKLETGAPPDGEVEHVVLPKRFVFEELKIVPQEWDRSLVQLVAGSHDPSIAALANRYLPCQVANLSITPPEVIERTHAIMRRIYHPDGGGWKRSYMPRTVMVFLNEEEGLDPMQRTAAAKEEAKAALSAYWSALTGTIDPDRIDNAADNAVIGNADDVAQQVSQRYHPEDRLMLWFDFFNHDASRVIRNMEAFMERVVPRLSARAVA